MRTLQWRIGCFWIVLASALWSLDWLLRSHLLGVLDAWAILWYEHLLWIVLLFALFGSKILRTPLPRLQEQLHFVLISLVGSIAGTYCFTRAFGISYTEPLLLQKLQPVIVATLAWAVLRERTSKLFPWLLVSGICGSYLVSFGWAAPQIWIHLEALLWSLGSVVSWSIAALLGRSVIQKSDFVSTTLWRFVWAFVVLSVITWTQNITLFSPVVLQSLVAVGGKEAYLELPVLLSLCLIPLLSGLVPMLIYYRGLASTPAHLATLCEGAYPIMGFLIGLTVLNPYGPPQTFPFPQALGLTLLLTSMLGCSRSQAKVKNSKT